MEATGVQTEERVLMRQVKPDMEYTEDEDVWTMTIYVPKMTKVIKFKLGEEFNNTTLNGTPIKSTITLIGKTLHEKFMADTGIVNLTREVNGDEMVSEAVFAGVKCTWIHKRG